MSRDFFVFGFLLVLARCIAAEPMLLLRAADTDAIVLSAVFIDADEANLYVFLAVSASAEPLGLFSDVVCKPAS